MPRARRHASGKQGRQHCAHGVLLHRHARRSLLLGLVTSFLDLTLADRLDASLLLTLALLFLPAPLLLAHHAGLFGLAGAALGFLSSMQLGGFLALLVVVLLLDAIFLKAHQLFEGEENGALFLFRHVRCSRGVLFSEVLRRPSEKRYSARPLCANGIDGAVAPALGAGRPAAL